MASELKIRSNVVAAKNWLAEGRERLRDQHLRGSPGIQVCALLTDLLDRVVLDMYQSALVEMDEASANDLAENVALVAHGGYGRRDVAPYSDVDLMILHTPLYGERVAPLAKRLLHDLFDAGLSLGQATRTPTEAIKLAFKDATIFTSLVESRFLAGSEELFQKFHRKFAASAKRRWRGMIGAIERARAEERQQFGETVYLLEPNIKRSPGGLRGIHLLRWVGFARYGESEPEALQLMDALSKEDQVSLRRASEFLLRLRNEMHFHAGKANDVLDRAEQVRVAEAFGYTGRAGLLPVEEFMGQFFRHTKQVRDVVTRFLDGARPWTKLSEFAAPLLSHQVEGDFRVGPTRISATRRGQKKLKSSLAEILRLADLANLYNKGIAYSTWKTVHEAAPRLPDELSVEASDRFLSLLSQPARLGPLLHDLHELGVLEKLIPEFAHARCLLQFNAYHKYTVDEHCIRAVERTTEFIADQGILGQAYRGLKEKRTLHLALLIHDLGKGYVEDHSEIGLRIAADTAQRLRLPDREAETLKFLVHKHLTMSHLAFRRDTSDEQVTLRFAVEVGAPEVLQMLYLLTCADLAAVGPGVLSDWKAEVLGELYQRMLQHLAGDSPSAASDRRRAAVRVLVAQGENAPWYRRQIDALPSSYLLGGSAERIADDLKRLSDMAEGEVRTWCRYLPETHTMEYTVGTNESITPGVFHKLTGALSSQGLQILSADINTLGEGLVLDRFVVQDPDYADEPPLDRQEDIHRRLRDSLVANQPPAFRRLWKSVARQSAALPLLPTRVKVDNSFSDKYTIIDVFTADRMGLLYTIARTLFETGLSVSLAKIGTYLDQVVDVFYVTDARGRKVSDEHRVGAIRRALLEAIEAHAAEAA